jgi:hypothetical protein
MDTSLLRRGDHIMVRNSLGCEPSISAIVIDFGMEAGRPVIDYADEEGNERWAYDYQVEPAIAPPTARELTSIALIVLIGFIAIYAELAFVTGGGW